MSEPAFHRAGEALRDLQALEVLEQHPEITQRDLAQRLGIAVGLTNACLRKMARKGLIKVRRINGRSIAYHLTPAGFAAKARLSVEFTEYTIGFYRHAKQTVSETLGALQALGVTRIVVVGATDLAEIVSICSPAYGIEIVAIVDGTAEGQERSILGRKTVPMDVMPAGGFDALVIADSATYENEVDLLRDLAGGRCVVWPAEGRIEPSRG